MAAISAGYLIESSTPCLKAESTAGRSESTPADCLPKTQLPANSQEYV